MWLLVLAALELAFGPKGLQGTRVYALASPTRETQIAENYRLPACLRRWRFTDPK